MGKKKGPSVDDLLILECKHWKVPMIFPEGKKEKKDAAEVRQNAVRERIKKAQEAYAKELAAPAEAMQSWFFHKSEAAIKANM